jgi:hypothetical protein
MSVASIAQALPAGDRILLSTASDSDRLSASDFVPVRAIDARGDRAPVAVPTTA